MKRQRGQGEVLGLLVVAVLFAAFMLIMYWMKGYQCEKRAKLMGLTSDYGFWTGCMVQVGERYAPINYIRIVDNKVIIQGDGE